ncbi:DUF4397 domain-containing protein [Halomicrococcus gelatinilyticus]|uniref:DUF4397 domain-containing protein n=1 Tax=Halomicrococcus gelatinilyticus TaxID=1702103 RepID=UPI002E148BAD
MRGKHTHRTVAVALVTLLLVGYGGVAGVLAGSASQSDEETNVRVAHMSPDAPAVDVLVDDETAVENLSFGNVTDYLTLAPGEANVTITAAGDPSTVVFSDEITFEAGTNYTVAATGEVTEAAETTFEPVVFEDDFTVPGPDEASVRLAHVSPDAPAVDVTIAETNETLFDNVTFQEATEYVNVPAGDYTLEVRPATEDDDGEVVAEFDVSLEGGTVYTAFAAGYLNPEDAPVDEPFQLITVVDAEGEKVTTTEAAPETTTTEKPVETTTEKPAKETTTEKPAKTTTTEKPVETTTTEKPAKETTTERPVETTTEKPMETTTEKPMETTTTEKPAKETTTERPVETTTEKPMETTTEKPMETTTTEKPAKETTTEKPVETTTKKTEPMTETTEKTDGGGDY